MQLTGLQIAKAGIITNYVEKGIQQQGLDVRLKSIRLFKNCTPAMGTVYSDKTICPKAVPYLDVTDSDVLCYLEDGRQMVYLKPGYYEVEFEEGCSIPNNAAMYFKTRSSLVRCGAVIHSGQFDGGFKTENMGAFLQVIHPIQIEIGARIAQAIVSETYPVDDEHMYDGQWQNDKQRS